MTNIYEDALCDLEIQEKEYKEIENKSVDLFNDLIKKENASFSIIEESVVFLESIKKTPIKYNKSLKKIDKEFLSLKKYCDEIESIKIKSIKEKSETVLRGFTLVGLGSGILLSDTFAEYFNEKYGKNISSWIVKLIAVIIIFVFYHILKFICELVATIKIKKQNLKIKKCIAKISNYNKKIESRMNILDKYSLNIKSQLSTLNNLKDKKYSEIKNDEKDNLMILINTILSFLNELNNRNFIQ